VNDVLDVSRIDQGVFRFEPQNIELSALVRDIVGAFEAAHNSIHVTVQQGDDIRVAGDPARLRQCLENIIANAIQKSPASAAINVFVRQGGLGLGLYLAKRIAAIHGGDLTADSEPGKGARFTLTLPALPEAE